MSSIETTNSFTEMAEADDICDLIERGHFDATRPPDQVIADLLKVARLCIGLRDDLMRRFSNTGAT
jgi:hypothetical protein